MFFHDSNSCAATSWFHRCPHLFRLAVASPSPSAVALVSPFGAGASNLVRLSSGGSWLHHPLCPSPVVSHGWHLHLLCSSPTLFMCLCCCAWVLCCNMWEGWITMVLQLPQHLGIDGTEEKGGAKRKRSLSICQSRQIPFETEFFHTRLAFN